ncbi:M48 family metallopeptidase [Psychrobium sp. MM17-31]|uniref:M48 family metallopeptidase n=1 Tax=Psychrobium sp. MM17-31 TaxID=2917758 RepID=UPI001EF48FA1|nr:M48 family metallopeptidase [Psychrobium sp. MM17-31]MCG7531988.1 M48 family metallopeptidase [Psychrobium sp. MM17-31]
MKKTLLALAAFTVVAGCQVTKSPTGRTQALMYSNADMSTLGAQSFDEMKKKEKIVTDPRVNSYVGCIADAITANVDASYGVKSWEVVVFDSPQINAFALPGGHIGVYTGLMKVATTADQLAAVMGHEVGHVLANHSNERLSRNQLTNMGMQIAGGAFDLAGINPQDKQLYMQGLGLGAQYGVAMPFGRKQESESDEIGLDLMAKAGFEPQASVTLWQAMAKASGGNQPMEFLSTHPSNERRIKDLTKNMSAANALYNQAVSAGKRPNCKL